MWDSTRSIKSRKVEPRDENGGVIWQWQKITFRRKKREMHPEYSKWSVVWWMQRISKKMFDWVCSNLEIACGINDEGLVQMHRIVKDKRKEKVGLSFATNHDDGSIYLWSQGRKQVLGDLSSGWIENRCNQWGASTRLYFASFENYK